MTASGVEGARKRSVRASRRAPRSRSGGPRITLQRTFDSRRPRRRQQRDGPPGRTSVAPRAPTLTAARSPATSSSGRPGRSPSVRTSPQPQSSRGAGWAFETLREHPHLGGVDRAPAGVLGLEREAQRGGARDVRRREGGVGLRPGASRPAFEVVQRAGTARAALGAELAPPVSGSAGRRGGYRAARGRPAARRPVRASATALSTGAALTRSGAAGRRERLSVASRATVASLAAGCVHAPRARSKPGGPPAREVHAQVQRRQRAGGRGAGLQAAPYRWSPAVIAHAQSGAVTPVARAEGGNATRSETRRTTTSRAL